MVLYHHYTGNHDVAQDKWLPYSGNNKNPLYMNIFSQLNYIKKVENNGLYIHDSNIPILAIQYAYSYA